MEKAADLRQAKAKSCLTSGQSEPLKSPSAQRQVVRRLGSSPPRLACVSEEIDDLYLRAWLMRVSIPYQPVHIALFLLLAFLCYQAHQWVRHLVGAALCGGFGSMTFTVATTK